MLCFAASIDRRLKHCVWMCVCVDVCNLAHFHSCQIETAVGSITGYMNQLHNWGWKSATKSPRKITSSTTGSESHQWKPNNSDCFNLINLKTVFHVRTSQTLTSSVVLVPFTQHLVWASFDIVILFGIPEPTNREPTQRSGRSSCAAFSVCFSNHKY